MTTFFRLPAIVLTFLFSTSYLFLSTEKTIAADYIRVSSSPVATQGEEPDRWQVFVMIRPNSTMIAPQTTVTVSDNISQCSFVKSNTNSPVVSQPGDLIPDCWNLLCLEAIGNPTLTTGWIEIVLNDEKSGKIYESVRLELVPEIDLSTLKWESYFDENLHVDQVSAPPGDDHPWQERDVLGISDDIGIRWFRTPFTLPSRWKAIPLTLQVPAIDDNDVIFINGHEIGRTNGWNTSRNYAIDPEILRFDCPNELLIAVNNTFYGGGIKQAPIRIGFPTDARTTPLFPTPEQQKESQRREPQPQGEPLPLRPFAVRDGVLEYVDGGEVALWGVNYYPQSWMEYKLLKEGNADIKATINADLSDLLSDDTGSSPWRINAIRIHVFDTEISDGQGNLIHNEHLDLLDYLVARCNERGIYLWLTPIAWWNGPQARRDSFSCNTPMPAMTLCEESWEPQQRYMREFLEHVNPYTGQRLVDEPCLQLFEIINEPLYWFFSDICGQSEPQFGRVLASSAQIEEKNDPNIIWRAKTKTQYECSLPDKSWVSNQSWDFYRYIMVRRYIDSMIDVIRNTGGKQPIAWHGASWSSDTPIYQAIADSRCDAVTNVIYPGGLQQTPHADAINLLPQTFDATWPKSVQNKARLVYEFDASDTLKQIDLYPAIARYFRNIGVQVACQFQYDSRFNAAHNRAWPTHYLNALHTPNRFVGFLIGGETFRSLPRGTVLNLDKEDELLFPPTAVSYPKNAAVLSKEELYMQARKTEWQPFSFPKEPKRIIAVDSTPYYQYDGTGIVDLTLIDSETIVLKLGNDVARLRDDILHGTIDEPLTRLEQNEHLFLLNLPGWDRFSAYRLVGSELELIAESIQTTDTANQLRLTAGGIYYLKRL